MEIIFLMEEKTRYILDYVGLEDYFKRVASNNNSIKKESEKDPGSELEYNLKECICSILSSEEKYRFLIKHVNDITFKKDIIGFSSQNLIQEITKDIMLSNSKNYPEKDILKNTVEENIRQILESEEKYKFLIDHIGEIIFICNKDYNFTFLNPQWNKMLGYYPGSGLGKCLFDFVHEEDFMLVKEKLQRLFTQSSKVINLEYRLKDFDGNWKHHLMTGTPIRNSDGEVVEFLGVSRDITDRKLLQMKVRDFNEQLEKKVRERTSEINLAYQELEKVNTKLIQSEKMAVVGELCSGVAHEFNNLIGIMHAYAEFTRSQPTEKNINKFIDAVLISSRRAKTIIQSLLSFARRVEPLKELANINIIVDEVLLLLETDFRKENISVIKDFDQNITNAVFDIGQIEQVLLNLLVNAKHALHDKKNPDGKKIIINTRNIENKIVIKVSDNGIGIKKCHLDKIFQPFFSTKGAHGKNKIPGAGLGLSVSFGIIENHQGLLEVDSEENLGTTFTITLPKEVTEQNMPVAIQRNVEQSNDKNSSLVSHPQYKKSASILVVDDEEYLRNALCDILSTEGYNLVPAEDGETAINLFNNSHFDLILMDIMMPGLNGFETIKFLKSIKPEVKIIILSGSSHYYTKNTFTEINVQGVIFKPFELDKLLTMISNVLGE